MPVYVSLFKRVWKYRAYIVLGLQVLSQTWKTAQDLTREYIRFLVREKLKRQILIIGIELGFLTLALVLDQTNQTLYTQLFASVVLWLVTLYNLFDLFFSTGPEMVRAYRMLKGKVGFALKHFLRVSVVNELLEWNVIFLSLCLFLAFSSRTWVATSFSYLSPWLTLF